ncbi:MAG: hypothetical protein ACYTHK_08415 [Planctomycetota bacterium]|jgi:hypothetical protein
MKKLAILLLMLAAALAQEQPKVWVHAPVEDLLALFPEKGAGFLISIEEYNKLRGLAEANRAANREKSPVDARLVRGTVHARLDGDQLQLEAEYVAVSQADGASELAFPVGGAALLKVEGAAYAGGVLRFEKPGTYTVQVKLARRSVASADGIRRVSLLLPPAAAHTVTLDLPPNVEGEVGPIARSFASGADGGKVTGYPDRRGSFRFWMRPRTRARRLDPIVSSTFAVMASIGETRTLASTRLDLEVLRAPITKATIEVPTGQLVHALTGKGVKTWRLVRGEARDTIEVTFIQPVQNQVVLTLETELPRENAAQALLPFPVVRNAVRYRGTVGLVTRPEVRVTNLRTQGARRLDRLPKQGVALFEIFDPGAVLVADVEPIAAKTRAAMRAFLAFGEGGKSLQLSTLYSIAGKPLFRLEPKMPPNWILRGPVTLNGAAIPHRLLEDGRLVLEFPNGLNPGAYILRASLDTDEVDWVPDDGEASFEWTGLASGLDEESGKLAVAADPAFRVAVTGEKGVRKIGLNELAGPVHAQTLFAWSFEKPGPSVSFSLRRHEPQLTATVIQRARPKERELEMHATVALKIERAGIRELRVALPEGTGKPVDFKGALIKERKPPATDADPEIWTLVFQRRIRGLYRLEVRYEQSFEEDRWDATVPALHLPDASESGFVVVDSTSMTAVTVDRGGLREADVAELPQPPKRSPLEVLAYSQHPFTVKLSSQRHDPQDVLQAIALSAHIYGVVSPEGRLRCRAEYRVRNNDQPFLFCRMPAQSTLIGALVDGKPIKPLLEAGRLKLPLARSRNRETPFVVAVVYESEIEELDDTAELTIGRPALDIDVLKTTYTLHLPKGYELTSHDGGMVPLERRDRPTVAEAVIATAGELGPPRLAAEAPAADTARVRQTLEEPARTEAEPEESRAYRSAEAAADKKVQDALQPQAEKALERRKFKESKAVDRRAPKKKKARPKGEKAPQFARGSTRDLPPPAPKPGAARRKQPERALLSLDVQFLKPDNVVRLESLAPTGEVTIAVAREEVFDVRGYLGIVLGLAFGVVFLLAPRLSLLRVLPAVALLMAALHFAGVSFLSAEFAIGASASLAFVLLLVLALRIPAFLCWVWSMLRKIRWPRKPAAGATALLLSVGLAQAEEIIAPYKGDDIDKIDRVFLPADRYHELRRLAYPEIAGRRTIVADAAYAAVRKGDEVTVTARYVIEKETDAAERIPLRLKDVAITYASLDDEPATLAVDSKQGYLLVLQGKGRHELELALRPRLVKRGKSSWFAIPIRPVATATLALKHDAEGFDLEVSALGGRRKDSYRLGPVAVLSAVWTPKTKGFTAPTAELRSESYLQCAIRDGFTAIAGRVRYSIAGGTVSRVRIAVDPTLTVRRVLCADLAGWDQDEQGTLQVALSKPAGRELTVEVWAERKTPRLRSESVPRFEPLDVLRDTGTITLESLRDLKLELTKTQGLLRGTLPRKVPKFRATPEWGATHSVHRFAVRPFSLEWKVSLEATRLRARTQTYLFLARDETTARVMLDVETERGPGEFELLVGLPKDYEVLNVAGPHLRDWWVVDGRLHVSRLLRQLKRARYVIDLRRRGKTADGVQAPALALLGAVRQTGDVQVRVADGLEVETGDSEGLLPVNLDSLRKPGTDRLLRRAYRYVAVPWSLSLSTREERREMDAMTITRVVPTADGVRVEALVNFHVRRGLVDEVVFTVPVEDENEIVLVAPEKREAKSVAIDGGRRYTLSLRNATRGSIAATVSYQVPRGKPVLGVEPAGIAQLRRYVIVDKIADGEVKVIEPEALESIEFRELPIIPPGASNSTAAAVFVGTGDPFLFGVEVKTHQFEEVEPALIYSAAAQVVVDRSGWTRTLVSYRVYNRTRQFLELALPDGALLYSVLVAGEGVRPLKRAGRTLVPLRKVAIGATTFDVDVVYAFKADAIDEEDWSARLPGVGGIDVRRTTVSLYLPKGFSYEFETEMEEVESTDIAVGQAADLFDEIKELYGVAERGNAMQVERALQNVAALEKEAKRVAEQVAAQSKDVMKVQKMESQTRALESLKRQTLGKRVAPTTPGGETDGIFRNLKQARVRNIESWRVNDEYLAKNKMDANEDLKQFDAANRAGRGRPGGGGGAYRGPSGGVPPGLRRPGDPEPPVAESLGSGAAQAKGQVMEDAPFSGPSTNSAIDVRARESTIYVAEVDADEEMEQIELDDVTSGLDDRAKFVPPPVQELGIAVHQLRRAAGRVSLRIDLPREGHVFHFATSGSRIELEVEADEEGGAFGKGLIAFVLLGAAVFVMRFGR